MNSQSQLRALSLNGLVGRETKTRRGAIVEHGVECAQPRVAQNPKRTVRGRNILAGHGEEAQVLVRNHNVSRLKSENLTVEGNVDVFALVTVDRELALDEGLGTHQLSDGGNFIGRTDQQRSPGVDDSLGHSSHINALDLDAVQLDLPVRLGANRDVEEISSVLRGVDASEFQFPHTFTFFRIEEGEHG